MWAVTFDVDMTRRRAVLVELLEQDGRLLSVDELAAMLQRLTPVAITDAADELQRLGLVHRVGDGLYCASVSARAAARLLGEG